MIIHGGKDRMSPISDMDKFANELKMLGAPVTFAVFPEEGHTFRKGVAEDSLYFLVEDFLSKWLGGARQEPHPDSTLQYKNGLK